MIKSLFIKNFILLKEAKLDFSQGFNVLCGETGAGKSIIIKALDSVLGAKINKEVIFEKDKPCYIEAIFEKNGIETTISREISTQSKFRLNGVLSSLEEIKELRENLVDIHSQHQTYSYIQPKRHIHLLDDYISKKSPEYCEILKAYKENFFEFKEIEKKLNTLKNNIQENEREIEFLKFQLKELDDASIRTNEDEELKNELDILSNAQELKEGSYSAFWALYGDNQSIVEALGKIKYSISSLSSLDKNLAEVESSLYDSFENLKDIANILRDYSSNLECNPSRLEEVNERLALIQKLKRKYGADLDLEREKISKRLEELTCEDNDIEFLEKNLETLLSTLDLLGSNIHEYRLKNAQELSCLVEEKLKTLELKEAKFEISINEVQKNDLGFDNVEFLITTNKNKDLAPLSKVASGGEISRVMLALKTIFALVDGVDTVVFDEIDTGISGVASSAVGNSMVELSKNTQIICITHQAIICAKADNFIWINKTQNDETNIKIEILDNDKKLQALAQLASGEVSQQTIDFAKTLVK